MWRRADGYVTITRGLADDLEQPLRPRGRAWRSCPTACGSMRRRPAPRPRPRTARPLVGYAGHLYAWKGVDVLLEALAALPEVDGLIVGGHEREPDLARVKALAERCGIAGPGDVHRPRRRRRRCRRSSARADVLVLPNPASAISTRFTSPLKLFEYMAAGRPIVASDLPAIREVLTPTSNAVLVAPGDAAALAAGIRRVLADPALAARLAGRGGGCGVGLHLGAPRRAARSAAERRDRAGRMISDRLLALVRCPECRATLTRDRRCASPAAAAAATTTQPAQRLPRPAARRSSSPSRPSTWTRRCTPTRATSGSRRRCSARGSATTCCATFLAPGPADRVVDLGCGSGRALLWNARLGRDDGRHRHQPVLRARRRARGVDLLLGDLRQLPFADGTFTKACSLDVLEHLSPEALRGMLAEAGARARAGRRAVRLHARPQERADRGRAALDQRPGAAARAARPDRHAPGAAAQVGSPEPAARHPRPRAGGARRRVPHRADPLLHADRRRLRREHHDARWPSARWRAARRGALPRHGARAEAADARARSARRAPRPSSGSPAAGPTYAALRGAVGGDEAGPAAVRADPVRSVLRAAGEERHPTPCGSSTPRSTRPCPARSAARCT